MMFVILQTLQIKAKICVFPISYRKLDPTSMYDMQNCKTLVIIIFVK